MKTSFKIFLILTLTFAGLSGFATTFTFSGGAWSPLTPAQTNVDTFIVNDINATLAFTSLANPGRIVVNTGGSLTISSPGSFAFDVGSSVFVDSAATLTVSAGFFGQITNNSIDFVINGQLITNAMLGFTNNGTIYVGSSGSFDATGILFINGPTGVLIIDGSLNVVGGLPANTGTISGNGVLTSSSGFPFFNGGTGTIGGQTGSVNLPASIPNIGDPNYIVYTGGAIPALTCANKLEVAANMTVNSSFSVGELFIRPGYKLTIISGNYVNICVAAGTYNGGIKNDGIIEINDGGALVQEELVDNNTGAGSYIISQNGHSVWDKYNIWSSPISGAAIGGSGIPGGGVFGNSNPCDIYMYDAPTASWVYDYPNGTPGICAGNSVTFNSSGDGVMDIARGYFVPGNGTVTTRVFNGEANNGNINASTVALTVGEFALVGNPYPSGLSAADFLTANSAILNGAVYFWDDDGSAGTDYDQTADYATWTLAGGVGTGVSPTAPGGGSGVIPNGNIGIAQGFWVEPSSAGTVSFNNSMRSDTNNQFFKTASDDINRIWLTLQSPGELNNNILVAFVDDATDGADSKYDGKKLQGNSRIRFASAIGTTEYAIQAIKPLVFQETKVIPLHVFSDESGIHTIGEMYRENFPSGWEVFIRDNELNVTHDLKNGSYSVNLVANQTYENRFSVIFKATSTTTGIEEMTSDKFILRTLGQGYILEKNSGTVNGLVQVLDITGRLIWSSGNISQSQVSIDLSAYSQGVYVVNVIEDGVSTYSSKIVK